MNFSSTFFRCILEAIKKSNKRAIMMISALWIDIRPILDSGFIRRGSGLWIMGSVFLEESGLFLLDYCKHLDRIGIINIYGLEFYFLFCF